MNAYLSQNKPLVVLMPDAQDDLLVSQSEAFAGRAADLTNRDIVIIEGINDKFTVDGAIARKLIAKTSSPPPKYSSSFGGPYF